MNAKAPGQEHKELLRRIASGDDSAETRLYELFKQPLFYFVRKKVNKSNADVEDICHDTLLAVLLAARNNKINSLSSFLYRVCSHKISDWIQPNRKTVALPHADPVDPDVLLPENPIDEESRKKLSRAFRKLKIKQRRVLYLKYVCEYSSKQIALRLEITPEAARQIAVRAVKKLRDKLSNYFVV